MLLNLVTGKQIDLLFHLPFLFEEVPQWYDDLSLFGGDSSSDSFCKFVNQGSGSFIDYVKTLIDLAVFVYLWAPDECGWQ